MALHVLDILKFVAQLHHRESNHPGIEAEGSSDGGLDGAGGVEAHDEVVAFTVPSLVFRGGLGESEGAPVVVAADDAA